MHQLSLILQTATATLLALTSLLLLRYLKQALHLWAGIGFTLDPLLPDHRDHFCTRIFSASAGFDRVDLCPSFFWYLNLSLRNEELSDIT